MPIGARTEDEEVEADLREVLFTFEVDEASPALRVTASRVTCVQDVPSLAGRNEPVLRFLERGLGDHVRMLAPPPVQGARLRRARVFRNAS